jgi:hypothetical protein
MLGRLIIAALVICSAAFVWWQKGRSEEAQLSSQLDGTKAADAQSRATAAERKAADAEQRAAQAEAKAAFYEQRMEAQRRAADAALEEQLSLHIADVKLLGVGKDVVGLHAAGPDGARDVHLAVSLEGPASDVARLRVFTSDGAGADDGNAVYDTQAAAPAAPAAPAEGAEDAAEPDEADDAGLLAVRLANAPWPHGPAAAPVVTTKDAKSVLDVALADDDHLFVNGLVVTVELTAGNGHVSKKTVTLFR